MLVERRDEVWKFLVCTELALKMFEMCRPASIGAGQALTDRLHTDLRLIENFVKETLDFPFAIRDFPEKAPPVIFIRSTVDEIVSREVSTR